MRKIMVAAGLILAGAAHAQSVATLPLPVAGEHPAVPADPGRAVPYDREGLSSRGGANPTGSDKTFSETIGRPIYGPIGTSIVTQIGVHH